MDPYAMPSVLRRGKEEKGVKAVLSEIQREIAYSDSDIQRALMSYGQNPDPVARRRGLTIYQEMMEDDQVKACVELRKQARLSTPWAVVPSDESVPEAVMYADFVNDSITRMQGTFEDVLYDVLSAIEFGFSVSELVADLIPDGDFKGKLYFRAVKTKEPHYYDFKTDEHGNLLGIVYSGQGSLAMASGFMMNQATQVGPANGGAKNGRIPSGTHDDPWPIEKFVVYSYNGQFANPYGRSDLLAAFRSWLSKKHVMKFWNVWLERYASPFVWAEIAQSVANKKKVNDEVDDFIRQLSARAGIRVPEGVKLNQLGNTTATGGDAYERAVEAHNRFIAHAILTPNLIGITGAQGSGGTGGTYALGKKHMDAFVWVLEKMGRDISETIVGEQIIRRLIELNFPNPARELMPIFKFEGLEEDSIEARARIVAILAQNGFINQEEPWVREFLTLPKREPEYALPEPSAARGGEETGEGDAGTADLDQMSGPDRSAAILSAKPANKPFQEREPAGFERKLQVRKFKKDMDGAEEALARELSEAVAEALASMLAYLERQKDELLSNPKAALAVPFPASSSSQIKESLRRWLVKVHFDSKLRAFEELGRAGVDIRVVRKFQDVEAPMENWTPLSPREAVDFFNRKVNAFIIGEGGRKVLVELASNAELPFYDAKAFAITGVIREDLLNDARQVILSGIRRQDYAAAVKGLKNVFNRYLESGIEVDEELLKPHRLNTIVNTNVVEAINNGRRSLYESDEVKDFVQFWQYSAILDDRTTDYCRCMDGKVFRSEDMGLLNPPAHYNCRSILVPVTKFEVEDRRAEGKGVEIANPCPDRMQGFAEAKRDPVEPSPGPEAPEPMHPVPRTAPPMAAPTTVDLPAARQTDATREADAKLRAELATIITRCPYTSCRSEKITMARRIMNVGEFSCGSCMLPFRVSNMGDLYLYDAGTEKWERATQGLIPSYFSEKGKPDGRQGSR